MDWKTDREQNILCNFTQQFFGIRRQSSRQNITKTKKNSFKICYTNSNKKKQLHTWLSDQGNKDKLSIKQRQEDKEFSSVKATSATFSVGTVKCIFPHFYVIFLLFFFPLFHFFTLNLHFSFFSSSGHPPHNHSILHNIYPCIPE